MNPPATATAPSQGVADEISVRCPADGRVVGSVPNMSAADVARLAADLRAAQPQWKAIGPKARAQYLLGWLDWIMDNENRIVELIQAESGKSWGDASIEIMVCVEV